MKKGAITVSVVLGLMAVANAAIDRVPIMKRKGGRKSHLRAPACSIIACGQEGDVCSGLNVTVTCMEGLYCVNGTCGVYKDGTECSSRNLCPGDDTLYCDLDESKCRPRKGNGENCTRRTGVNECKDGFFCNSSSYGYSNTQGTCLPQPTKVNDPCNTYYSDPCPHGTRCSNYVCKYYPSVLGEACEAEVGCNNSDLRCYNGTCSEYPKEGEACINNRCAEGFYCSSGMCAKYAGRNESCNSDNNCVDGLYCISNRCNDLPGENEDCRSGWNQQKCAEGLVCNSTSTFGSTGGKCVRPAGEDEKCTNDDTCAGELYCNSNICSKSLPGEGEACKSGFGVTQCAEGLYCNSTGFRGGYCVALPGVNETCGSSGYVGTGKCADGLYCSGNKCVEYPGVGEECYQGSCREGLVCDMNETRRNVCFNPVAQEGEHCSTKVECGAGLVCNESKCIVGDCISDEQCKYYHYSYS